MLYKYEELQDLYENILNYELIQINAYSYEVGTLLRKIDIQAFNESLQTFMKNEGIKETEKGFFSYPGRYNC